MSTGDEDTIRKLRRLTIVLGIAGTAGAFLHARWRGALGFGLGAAGSWANLWVFDWLSRGIAPGDGNKKPWPAGTYVIRFVFLLAIGYVIVSYLGVPPVAVVLGLLTSTAATLITLSLELVKQFRKRRSS